MGATEAVTPAATVLDDLYRRHAAEVFRYAYAVLGNAADAEDVTQTTFVNALRALERGERPRAASHWLIAIAHNLVRQRFRQQARSPGATELRERDAPVGEMPTTDPSLDDLVRALQQIPPAQREALVMRELEGRPYAEIAEILGISTGALETLLFRARRSLTEELEHLVTCNGAELALSRGQDGRLPRKERRRLQAHLRECPRCARLASTRAAQGRAWKGLAVLPLPVSLHAVHSSTANAAATASLPTIGATTTVAGAGGVGGGSVVAGAGGGTAGLLVVKAAAVAIVAATAIGGAGYGGLQLLGTPPPAAKPEPRSTPAAATRPGARDAGAPAGTGRGPATPGDVASTGEPSAPTAARSASPEPPANEQSTAASSATDSGTPAAAPAVHGDQPGVVAPGAAHAAAPALRADQPAVSAAATAVAEEAHAGVPAAGKKAVAPGLATAPGQVKKTAPAAPVTKNANAATGKGELRTGGLQDGDGAAPTPATAPAGAPPATAQSTAAGGGESTGAPKPAAASATGGKASDPPARGTSASAAARTQAPATQQQSQKQK